MITEDLLIGAAYSLATLPLIFYSSRMARIPRAYAPYFLIATGSVWIFYLIRPLFLVANPDFFTYQKIGSLETYHHVKALIQIGIYSFLFLGGMHFSTIIKIKGGGRTQYNQPISAKRGLLLRSKQPIILFLLIFVLFDTYMLFFYKIGVSGTYSPYAFIRLLLPLFFILPLIAVYLVSFKNDLKFIEKNCIFFVLFLMFTVALFQGHKSSFIYIFYIFFLVYLISRGDITIPAGKTLVTSLIVFTLFLITFPLGNAIRNFMQSNSVYTELSTIFSMVFAKLLNFDYLIHTVNKATARLCGYDGLLVVELYRPPEILHKFNELYILKQILSKLLPKYSQEGYSLGKAIGIYYSGHTSDIRHAGALGLYGSVTLIGNGILSYVYMTLIGIFYGSLFRFVVKKIHCPGTKLLLAVLISMKLVSWLISGNLDNNIQGMIVAFVHLIFFGTLLWILYGLTSRPLYKT